MLSSFAKEVYPSIFFLLLAAKITTAGYINFKIPKQLDGTDFVDQNLFKQRDQKGYYLIGWSFRFVNYAIKTGIMKGTKGGNYNPTENISRKEAITVLVRTLCHKHDGSQDGEKESNPICKWMHFFNMDFFLNKIYPDIEGANRSEFFAYILAAKLAGFLDGYVEKNSFKPEQPLMRWEMALSTCRLFSEIVRHKTDYSLNICN
ncbi:MAG: S-layer homology domain-containing protein [Candidatus Parabeggiatoa sp.]|nr:S-layer homology domain-containing protein [Candidatus Parabeggiatoa sp.]